MGKRKSLVGQVFEQVEVLDAAAEGKSVARVNDMVLFVKGGVPGDVADVKITLHKRRFLEGEAFHFHKYSEKRAEPFCRHFGECGGCKWQHLDYGEQLFYKQKQVRDNFERIGHLEFPEPDPIFGSVQTRNYRNKLDFTFSSKSWMTTAQLRDPAYIAPPALGFHIPGKFDKILHIEECHLQTDASNAIRNALYAFALQENLSFFDLRAQTGFLRNLVIRTSNTGEVMVIVVVAYEEKTDREKVLEFLQHHFPEITSLFYVINSKRNDSLSDQDMILYRGKEFLTEEMEGLRFKVGPKSFFQTNSAQAYELYKITRDFAGLSGKETVYDLYTGTGTIAQFVARKAHKVIGIEYVSEAIDDARSNAEANGITNTLFFAGDMKDVLNEDFIATHGPPDVIITDPPRAGMHPDVTEAIRKAAPEKIVYVSCNPATQARDLALLKEQYEIIRVQPVDMFPHTHHVENVVLLRKKS